MPFLQYRCPKCQKRLEEYVQNISEKVVCPDCGEVCVRDYSGEIYSATGKPTKKCTGNCKTCGGCH